ncbi:MAG: hypothetical protein Q7S31_01360 [bacterium]|nr:hypothetical protein [bacterium]
MSSIPKGMFRDRLRQILESNWRLGIEVVATACFAYGTILVTKSLEANWPGLLLMGIGGAVLGADAYLYFKSPVWFNNGLNSTDPE